MAGLLFLIIAVSCTPSPTAFLLSVVIHEAGHIISALFMKIGKPRIALKAAGIQILYPAATGYKNILLCISGPILSLIFSLITKGDISLYCAVLGILNLMPVSCLDGGGILRCVTEKYFMPRTAYIINRTVSTVFVLIMIIINAAVQMKYGINLSLIAVTLYVTVSEFTLRE